MPSAKLSLALLHEPKWPDDGAPGVYRFAWRASVFPATQRERAVKGSRVRLTSGAYRKMSPLMRAVPSRSKHALIYDVAVNKPAGP